MCKGLGEDPAANRRFVKLSEQFVLVSHDIKNGTTHLSRELGLGSIEGAYFLVFGVYEGEIERWGLPRKAEFDEAIIERLKKIEQNYINTFRRQLWEYIATYRTTDKSLRTEIDSLVIQLGSEQFRERKSATWKLAEFGEPAILLLEKIMARNNIHDAEIKARIRKILGRHRPQRVLINRKGLDHDIVFLLKGISTVPKIKERLRSILPDGITVETETEWWKEHGHRYQWDTVLQKYRLK